MDNYSAEHDGPADLDGIAIGHDHSDSPSRRPLAFRVAAAVLLVVLIAGLAAAFNAQLNVRTPVSTADPGQQAERSWPLPKGTPAGCLTDATIEWGLKDRAGSASADPMAGGVATIDLDRDGVRDRRLAHDTV